MRANLQPPRPELASTKLVQRRPAGVGKPVVYALAEAGRSLEEPMRAFRQWRVTHLTRSAGPDAGEQRFDVTYVEGIAQLPDEEFELRVGDAVSSLSLRKKDFVKAAQADGFEYAERIERKDDVPKMVEDFLAFDGPAFLDVLIDPQASVYPMVGPGMSYHDMITGDFIPNRYEARDPSEPESSEMF